MDSLLAAWRVSLRRMRDDWPVVAAAWLIVLLSATLFAAGPIYSSAASLAGLRQALADASVPDTTVQVSLYLPPAGMADADRIVQAAVARAMSPLVGPVVRDQRLSASLDLPADASAQPGDQAILGALDDLRDHATLVDGAWPVARTNESGALDVAVVEAVASELGLHVGDSLPLVGHRFGRPFTVDARLAGIFTEDSASDPYWYGDDQLLTGITGSGATRTFGPFLASPDELARIPGVDSIHMHWRAFPTFDQLSVDDAVSLRAQLQALPDRLRGSIGDGAFVSTGLPRLLAETERSLLVTRTEVLLLMLQQAIMAVYAILLTGSLLGEHRRLDTSLLRSRGAGTVQMAWLSLGEGLAIALPAVLIAPWLALAALAGLNVVGPLADAGLRLAPAVTLEAYAWAAAAGLGCVALLVWPAVRAARGYASEQRELSRQETRTLGDRLGLDIALLAVAAIAFWQLRLYGAPLTRDIRGSLGVDPLLVAAPAAGLLAGGIVALRLLPGLARAAERAIARGRNLVGSLGTRQLARRPLRYTRSALLVMLALSMGVFGLSYAATWSSSQQDQAAYQAGAAVRVLPTRSPYGLPAWALPVAYAALPGVEALSPVEREAGGVRVGSGSADLLAVDAATASDVMLFRADESTTPLAELLRPLSAGRPAVRLVALPSGAAFLRAVAHVDLGGINVGSGSDGSARPLAAGAADTRVSVNAVIRDAHGLLHQVQADSVHVTGPDTTFVLQLMPASGPGTELVERVGGRLDEPIELAALGLEVSLPANSIASAGTVGISGVSSAPTADGPWMDLGLGTAVAWSAELAQSRGYAPVPAAQTDGTSIQLTGQGEVGALLGGSTARVSFKPSNLTAALAAPVPIIANRAFLERNAAAVGDILAATVAGGLRQLVISGVVEAFPTTDPARPLLVVDEPTVGLLGLDANAPVRSPDEWWLAATDGSSEQLAATLTATPFDSASVVTATGRADSLRADPVALGIIGALLLGSLATGLFAVVGLTVSAAVAARQRRTEFALLRALGLSARQLSAWLWLENGSLVAVSLVAGTLLGLLIGWLVLPFATVTQQATTPVPPAIVRVPWDQVMALDVVSAVALGSAVVLIGRVLRTIGVGSVLRMGED